MSGEYFLSDEDTGDIYPVSVEEGLDMSVFEDKKKSAALVGMYACLTLWILTAAYRFCFG